MKGFLLQPGARKDAAATTGPGVRGPPLRDGESPLHQLHHG